MQCKKCKASLPRNAVFCAYCGHRIKPAPRKPRKRGNGQGSVYQIPNGRWRAIKVSLYTGEDGKVHRKSISRSDFTKKSDAIAYLPLLGKEKEIKQKSMTFKSLYDHWEPTHNKSQSTMNCYHSAMKYYKPIWNELMTEIDIDDLQECVDNCGKGKRTRENMKALAGLLYKYGIPRNCIRENLNLAEYIRVGGGEVTHKDAITDDELLKIKDAIGEVQYAEYIYCQCYLGFRPSEFLALNASMYNRKERAFVGGGKTEAGKDRTVTVSPKIQKYVDDLIKDKQDGPVFCDDEGKHLSAERYRSIFYNVLEQCGIQNEVKVMDGKECHRLTPHSCRHTFATLMKRVNGNDKDKLELIGHTSEEMLRYYQDVNFEDLRRITNSI